MTMNYLKTLPNTVIHLSIIMILPQIIIISQLHIESSSHQYLINISSSSHQYPINISSISHQYAINSNAILKYMYMRLMYNSKCSYHSNVTRMLILRLLTILVVDTEMSSLGPFTGRLNFLVCFF